MGEKIKKPDANPLVAALLTWFVLGLGHYITNGQKEKWVKVLITWLVAYVCCCLPGILIGILSTIDAYKIAQRLQAGKEVDAHEYAVPLLFKFAKIFDKEAILVE